MFARLPFVLRWLLNAAMMPPFVALLFAGVAAIFAQDVHTPWFWGFYRGAVSWFYTTPSAWGALIVPALFATIIQSAQAKAARRKRDAPAGSSVD